MEYGWISVIKGMPEAHFMQGIALWALPSHRRGQWLRRAPGRRGARFIEAQRRAPQKIWDEEDYQDCQYLIK